MIFSRRNLLGPTAAILLAASSLLPARAEQVGKKLRVSFAAGIFDGNDRVPSNSANELRLFDSSFQLEQVFQDPRNDSSAFGSLNIQPAPLGTLAAQYAVNNIFLLEASVGYQKGDLGDVEMQAQFAGVQVLEEIPFDFTTFRIAVGEITRIPLQFSGVARFRPRARFNPYAGGGIGYSFIGFEAAEEFNELSVLLDSSRGGQTRLAPSFPGSPGVTPPLLTDFRDLEGASVDARDTFEWHVLGGAELSLRRSWSVFGDLRYTRASREIQVGFNGSDGLGIEVPQLLDFFESGVTRTFGPMQINEGGLVDAGTIVLEPRPDASCGELSDIECCKESPGQCFSVFQHGPPDGQLDPGLYYLQGGGIDYSGLSYQFGVRFTFK